MKEHTLVINHSVALSVTTMLKIKSITDQTHKRIHTGDKPISCSQFDYKCSTSNNLKQHERIHSGDKPFGCSQCDYKTSDKGTLKRHERIHTDERPFCCTKCDTSFKSARYLREHGLKCSVKQKSQTGSFLQEIKIEPNY